MIIIENDHYFENFWAFFKTNVENSTKATTTEQVFVLINRFKKLNIACLQDEIKQKWEVYCKHYNETLVKIRREYDDAKANSKLLPDLSTFRPPYLSNLEQQPLLGRFCFFIGRTLLFTVYSSEASKNNHF